VFRRDPFADPEPLIRRVYAYVAYRVGDGPDAEDITSETFERALRYRESFDPRKGDVVAWLIGIARRRIADAGSQGAFPLAEAPEQVDPASTEDDTLRHLDLAAGFAQLEARDRELLALRYGADLTAAQIGSILELKTNAVEVALHRALARLRDALEASDVEAEPLPRRRSL
jgi:RNA polymerase sigma factor (sigma-70 family)